LFEKNVFPMRFACCDVCPISRDTKLFQDTIRLSGIIPATAGHKKGHDGNRSLFVPRLTGREVEFNPGTSIAL
jgi:hypothetical protein